MRTTTPLENMNVLGIPAPEPTPVSEHEARFTAVRSALADTGLDALIAYADCWRTANVRYFTDFRPVDGVHEIAQAVVVIPRDGEAHLFVGDGTLDYARSETRFPVETFAALRGRLTQLARGADAVGLAGREHLPVALHDEIVDALGVGVRLVDTDILARLKAVKSPWEVEQLRRAARITDYAMEAVRELVTSASDVTERDVARAADVAMIQAGADTTAYLSMVHSGGRGGYSLALPTNRRLEHGDLVMTDIGARYGNYVADGGRGFVFGAPSNQVREIVETAGDAVEAGLAAARPGMTAAELNAVVQSVLVDRGFARYSGEAMGRGTGHGTGMDPEEELPWIGPSNDEVIRAGSVFTLKATINVPDVGGLRTERIVHLASDGLETLDAFPMRNYW